MDDAMLRAIASADYGDRSDENYAVLKRICESGELPVEHDPWLIEVVSLTRWSEPSLADIRGHLNRAFSCVILLRSGAEATHLASFDGENNTVAQLLVSAWALGPEFLEPTYRIILWRFEIGFRRECSDRAFFAFALLALAVALREGRFSDEELTRLAIWTCEEESRVRNYFDSEFGPIENDPPPGWSRSWLVGLPGFNQKDDAWQSIGRWLFKEADAIHCPITQEWLRLLGACLK